MEHDSTEIRAFLAARHPFDQLPAETLDALPESVEVRQAGSGTVIFKPEEVNTYLYTVRSGALEVHGPDGDLLARLGEGDVFGYRSLLRDGRTDVTVHTIEDSELYQIPQRVFQRLLREHPRFAYFFGPTRAQRLRGAMRSLEAGEDNSINLMATAVEDILGRAPVALSPGATVQEAARTMTAERVSSLLVVEDGRLQGVVTDRDLRSRVLAEGRGYDTALSEIMTTAPLTIEADAYAYEALLAMARSNVHHLPVMDGQQVLGMITTTDLVQRRSTSAVYLVGDIYKHTDLEGLVKVSQRVPAMLRNLVEADASAHSIGRIITSIGEAITCRLLQLAEDRLGPPPVAYAWLAGGSQARMEQTAHSDQDNCLLLSDEYREAEHGQYFETLANLVCDGLDACGYVYCPGEVMAKNPRWRQPLKVWKDYFRGWIDQPDPDALMHASVFFDLRRLYGDRALLEELQHFFLERARANRIFQVFLATNVMKFQPPLGFFRHFVLIKGGEHDHTLDLKHSGVVPVIDLARVHALAAGIAEVNTQARLEAAGGQGSLSTQGAANLRDALEFISMVRLRHQARQIRDGEKPDNYMRPEAMSTFERNHLKDAFAVVRTLQNSLAQRYQLSRFT